MKRPKLTNMDIADTIDKLNAEHQNTIYLLTVYKNALFNACYELSQLLDNTNPKTDENYWLLNAIKYIEKLKGGNHENQ